MMQEGSTVGGLETIAIVFGIIAIFVLGLAFAAFYRYLRYKETVALAEKGLVRPESAERDGASSLRWGLIVTALGMALCIGLYPVGFLEDVGEAFPLRFGPWMLIGLIPTFFGLALIVIYLVTYEEKSARRDGERELEDQP
ncbi:MAG TPA: DUF6249 domain-containing protein [Ardenticatenaceae bacterium]|nr:DUF6249 domain-containing protein [Ardenticatenaceae bacterium]